MDRWGTQSTEGNGMSLGGE